MARKPMSEEAKQAARERLAAARAKKQAKQTTPETKTTAEPTVAPTEPMVQISQSQLDKFISLLESAQTANVNVTPQQKLEAQAEMEGVTVTADGMKGTLYKYPIEADYYNSPTERIFNMPELSRFAPRENYEIQWEVKGTFYENERTHVYYAEPTFTITILRVMYGDDGLPTTRRAIVGKNILHEDEVVANAVARELGLSNMDKRQLLEEVRFQRIRRWILDLLIPANRQKDRVENIGEMVVDGKVVPFIEVETNADKAINPSLNMDKLR